MKVFSMDKAIWVFGLVALTACSPGFLGGSAGSSINSDGSFGSPTRSNTQAQIAYGNKSGLFSNLSRKFEKDVPSMVNFAFNSARLDATSRAILNRQADWIKQFPEVKFRVYGYTDLVGTERYNQRLGLRRAKQVVHYLVSQGISSTRLEAVASFGETRPLVVTEKPNRRNRRAMTEVIGFAPKYVGAGLDGKYARLVYRVYIASPVGASTVKSGN